MSNSLYPFLYSFFFEINDIKFSYIDVFISDNYLNDLDWQQYSFGLTQHKQEVYFRLKKTQEQNLAEPYNQCEEMFDVTYRQANCLAWEQQVWEQQVCQQVQLHLDKLFFNSWLRALWQRNSVFRIRFGLWKAVS